MLSGSSSCSILSTWDPRRWGAIKGEQVKSSLRVRGRDGMVKSCILEGRRRRVLRGEGSGRELVMWRGGEVKGVMWSWSGVE